MLAAGIIAVRRVIPESPRRLLTHGRADEAERVVAEIEEGVRRRHRHAGADAVLRRAGRDGAPSLIPFAAGNVLGPLILGPLFDGAAGA